MVTWSNDCWASKMRYVARGESYAEKNSLRVEAVISEPQKYINQKMTAHQRVAIKNGMMPAAVLKRNTRNVKPHEREQILNDLLDADVIGTAEAHENICFFKKSFD